MSQTTLSTGNDSFSGGSGNDSIIGERGSDTLLGDSGSDTILGDRAAQNGNDGNDSIFGGTGNDSLFGGSFNDTIDGGADNDTIYGDQAADLGRDGNDSLVGGAGNDFVDAGDGNNTADGGTGNDTLIGRTGNDSIVAGDGDDSISAGAGADTINAGAGNDTILSGTGNDFIIGGKGNDSLIDEFGADTFAWAPGQGSDTLRMVQGTPADAVQINIPGFNTALGFFGMPNVITTTGTNNAINGFVLISGQNTGNAGAPAVYKYLATGEILNTEGVESFIPCFYPGTMIATPTGERAVETLAFGDLVLTSEGQAKPVRWMGRQTVSTRFGDPLRMVPVRVLADALADGVPARDLLVSPDHALLVEGVLIQAGALVNGITILRQFDVPEVFTYYHIELAEHDLVLAEGTPAETFVDNIDRLNFDNWAEHEALYGDEPSIPEMDRPRAKSQRQVPRFVQLALEARARLKKIA